MSATMTEIEDLHREACSRGELSYIDPLSGYTCFTQLQHLKKGKCCGNQCRHCPYNFMNVKPEKRDPTKVPVVAIDYLIPSSSKSSDVLAKDIEQ